MIIGWSGLKHKRKQNEILLQKMRGKLVPVSHGRKRPRLRCANHGRSARKNEKPMGLNIARQTAKPGENDAAIALLNSFYGLREFGVIFGFWTNKIFKEIDALIAQNKLVEDYDLEQLRIAAGKDVREHFYADTGLSS
jgi:hypothetical protein